jgi:hypothetical protein
MRQSNKVCSRLLERLVHLGVGCKRKAGHAKAGIFDVFAVLECHGRAAQVLDFGLVR